MLKIYLCRTEYEIHNENKTVFLNTYSDYVVKDEDAAKPTTIELGAYTDEAQHKYAYSSSVCQKKKGRHARFWGWPNEVYLDEWKAPDAKLVMHITYKEKECSMREFMRLPVSEVIAYLKQEGLNLVMPS